MNRRSALRLLMCGSAGSSILLRAAFDEPQNLTIRSDVGLVVLDVSVKDADGNDVPGLAKSAFRVTENGRLQRISVFDPEDRPVTVGILVDESRSMTPKRLQVLEAAQTFVEESNRRDEMFVLHFNDHVTSGLPRGVQFSDDVQKLRAALNRGVPEGRTALYDAVIAGLKHLDLGKRDRKAIVVITDGGDTASRSTRREMLDLVERSNATIYTIGLFDADDPKQDPGILRQLARMTGGNSYRPATAADVAPGCRLIAKEIRSRYTIGYPVQPEGGILRHIRVAVSAPGYRHLTVRTRSSYRYDQADAQTTKKSLSLD